MKTKLTTILLAVLLTSCTAVTYTTGERVNYLRVGDTKQTVQRIYGMPCDETRTLNKDKFIDEWVYCATFIKGGLDTSQKTIVVFVDNKLIEVK